MPPDETTNPNRINPVTVANAATDAKLAPISVSPTGTPLIPARFVPWLMIASGLFGLPALLASAGIAVPAVVVAVSTTLAGVTFVLLGGSPGLRKQP